ncbi:MAG: hypothetical protein KDD25_00455 [Bdellovibrionales bacterium]|nr:hypothetical protein [Bdellovibrionales bacterium]
MMKRVLPVAIAVFLLVPLFFFQNMGLVQVECFTPPQFVPIESSYNYGKSQVEYSWTLDPALPDPVFLEYVLSSDANRNNIIRSGDLKSSENNVGFPFLEPGKGYYFSLRLLQKGCDASEWFSRFHNFYNKVNFTTSTNGTVINSGISDISQPTFSSNGRYLGFALKSNYLLNDAFGINSNGTVYVRKDTFNHKFDAITVDSNNQIADFAMNNSFVSVTSDGAQYVFSYLQDLVPANFPDQAEPDGYLRKIRWSNTTRLSNEMNTNVEIRKALVSGNGSTFSFLMFDPTESVPPGYSRTLHAWAYRSRKSGPIRLSLIPGTDPSLYDGGSTDKVLLSNNGTIAVFSSRSNLLLSNNQNQFKKNVFVYDLTSGDLELISNTSDGQQLSGGDQILGQFAGNGKFVVIESQNAAISPNGNPSHLFNMYLKDLTTGELSFLSVDGNGSPYSVSTASKGISGNGRYLLYSVGSALYHKDIGTNMTTLVETSGTLEPGGISDDGMKVAYVNSDKIYVWLHPCINKDVNSDGVIDSNDVILIRENI